MKQIKNDESFQYSWLYMLYAYKALSKKENINFIKSNIISPYMEVNNIFINDDLSFSSNNYRDIEINPFIRYTKIYSNFFECNELTEIINYKNAFFNLTFHLLTNLDLYEGLNKKDIFVNRILKNIRDGIFGNYIVKNINALSTEDQLLIAEIIYNNYENKSMMESFKCSIILMFIDSIVYDNLFSNEQIIIFINENKTVMNKMKFKIIQRFFLPLGLKVKVFWKYHFGIIDNLETLKIGEVAIF